MSAAKSAAGENLPVEAWLRGILPVEPPVIGHLLQASTQIREEIAQALDPLTPDEVWATPHGMTSVGFHAKHLAGSTLRMCRYLQGRTLDAGELAAIQKEKAGSETAPALIALVNAALDLYEEEVRALSAHDFGATCHVGRARLPVTAIGLAVHIAEHGQRHLGQLISASKLARAGRRA